MSTLVVCVDRTGDVAAHTGVEPPVAGWEAVRSLALDLGLADPEDSAVNTLLEGLRVTRDLRDDEEDATVAVVSAVATGPGGPDRSIAGQLDVLIDREAPDRAVVVLDSAEDERVLPVVESRLPVDAVDRVVVRQARDIESTYYLLKQFLADEELRGTVLVPVGIVLLVFPGLMFLTGSIATAGASITAVLGVFLLYKGLGVDDRLAALSAEARTAMYSGRVSVVTYAVGGGLALIGLVAGALGVSALPEGEAPFVLGTAFAYHAVAWAALAALVASAGRLFDRAIQTESLPTASLNVPFVVVALGLVVRGFAGYFLQVDGHIDPATLPLVDLSLAPEQRLAVAIALGVLISLLGIAVSSRVGDVGPGGRETGDDPEVAERDQRA